jgi:hypothetical protein
MRKAVRSEKSKRCQRTILVNQTCTLCGKEFSRLPWQADAKNPFCDTACNRLYESIRKSSEQTIYTSELLRDMAIYEGEGCAFPGCGALQHVTLRKDGAPRANQPNNSFHLCTFHLKRLRSAMRERRKKRRHRLREIGLLPKSQSIWEVLRESFEKASLPNIDWGS